MTSATKKRPILVVDDEPDMLCSLQDLLRRDFAVHTAPSGAAAIQVLAQCEIHIVLTDQRMPQMTGVEFLRRIKHSHPEAIRMIFTGYADVSALVDAINQGNVFRYLAKPWEPDDLFAALHAAAAAYDEIIERNAVLEELGIYEARGIAFDEALRAGRYGALTAAGLAEAEHLVTTGRALSARLDKVLSLVHQRGSEEAAI